jgi:hypothetical protein
MVGSPIRQASLATTLSVTPPLGGNTRPHFHICTSCQKLSAQDCLFWIIHSICRRGHRYELAVITFGVYWPTGFHFRTPGGGAELPFLWGMMVFVVALRGGGPFSLDRKIGWEL